MAICENMNMYLSLSLSLPLHPEILYSYIYSTACVYIYTNMQKDVYKDMCWNNLKSYLSSTMHSNTSVHINRNVGMCVSVSTRIRMYTYNRWNDGRISKHNGTVIVVLTIMIIYNVNQLFEVNPHFLCFVRHCLSLHHSVTVWAFICMYVYLHTVCVIRCFFVVPTNTCICMYIYIHTCIVRPACVSLLCCCKVNLLCYNSVLVRMFT